MPGWSRTWQCQGCKIKVSSTVFDAKPPEPQGCGMPVGNHDWQILTSENAHTRWDRWMYREIGVWCSIIWDFVKMMTPWAQIGAWRQRRRDRREMAHSRDDLLELARELQEDR